MNRIEAQSTPTSRRSKRVVKSTQEPVKETTPPSNINVEKPSRLLPQNPRPWSPETLKVLQAVAKEYNNNPPSEVLLYLRSKLDRYYAEVDNWFKQARGEEVVATPATTVLKDPVIRAPFLISTSSQGSRSPTVDMNQTIATTDKRPGSSQKSNDETQESDAEDPDSRTNKRFTKFQTRQLFAAYEVYHANWKKIDYRKLANTIPGLTKHQVHKWFMDERRRPHKKEGANASSSSPEPTRVKSKSKPQRKKGVERQQVATSGPVFRDRVLSKRITKPVTVKKSSQRGRRRLGGSDANIETSAQPARAGSRSTEILGSEVPSDAIAKNTRRSTKLKAIAESSATGVDDDMGAQQDDTDFMALTDRETLLSKEIHELKQRCEKQKVRIAATRIALHAQQTELQQIQLSLENTRGEYNTVQTNLQQLQF